MTTIVTRAGKGSPLTHTEVDTNFTNLNTNKLEAGAIALGSAATPSISFTGDTNTGIYSPGADQVAVATNGTGRLFVDASGSVGLGTSQNPTAGGFPRPVLFLKQFTDPVAGFGGVHIEASGDQSVLGIGYDGTAQVFAFDTSFRGTGARRPIIFKTTGAECMRIDASGNVGIGISTPGAKLEVYDTRNSTLLRLTAQGGENWDFKNTNTVGSTDVLTIGAAGATANLALDDVGRVGIGTTSPGAPVNIVSNHSAGTLTTSLKLATVGGYAPNSGTCLDFGVDQGDYSTWLTARIGAPRTGDNYGGSLVFYTNRNTSATDIQEAARIDSSGRLGIGSNASNANGGILQLSGGITFPATAVAASDANTLDDYEEGTWTPNQGSGLTVVGAFSSIGRYTKIGNVVTIWGDVTGATSIAVSAIGVITTNIPFALDNAIGAEGVATGFWSASNSVIHISLGTTTTIYAAQAISGSATIGFTITYRV